MAVSFKDVVSNMMGPNWTFAKEIRNDSDYYIALFNNEDPEVIPDKMAVGINKHSGKTAYSHLSLKVIEDAIKS